ncbi:aminotransferase class I/II-fold pyridoxal phosphate-dependent enzyme [uncultured Tenacibaculum sp.]|uniref:aminotransferase class I/II-fold pyridoxal phosphate-dependent enzyme n=1 Tax=uncultured Tenacibaculum sp. TaxID=174713 RepID=UPI0026106323|nr:aminotransferase class I/II-fold pyridoxal phosphate-dependent enzyme [uncultured Tenacibaculum sp.]
MKINDFKLERYFAQHEFTAKYLLSSSDCDGYELNYILENASNEELKLWENLKLGYTESEGNPLLREAILQHYNLNSIENVVVATPGELNFISMNVLLNATDHAITVSPCYQSLSEVVKSIHCELSFWKPNSEDWTFNTEDLEKLIQKNTKLIILNFPHNPTGSYLTKHQLNEIVAIARKHDIYIFSDEMYHKLIHGDTEELHPICDLYEKGISLWGTSKTFGLAGLRTGWLVSQDKSFLQKVVAFKDYLSICNSAPSEILSIMALNNINSFLEPNLKKINSNITVFSEFVDQQEVITNFVPPKAGSTSFVQLNIDNSALEFSNILVKETGIMTVPSEMFEYEGKYIRIGFGRANFAEIIAVLDHYLKTN